LKDLGNNKITHVTDVIRGGIKQLQMKVEGSSM